MNIDMINCTRGANCTRLSPALLLSSVGCAHEQSALVFVFLWVQPTLR